MECFVQCLKVFTYEYINTGLKGCELRIQKVITLNKRNRLGFFEKVKAIKSLSTSGWGRPLVITNNQCGQIVNGSNS